MTTSDPVSVFNAAVAALQSHVIEIATVRRQPDGTWRMIADDTFLGVQNMFFYFGSESTEEQA